MKEVKSKDKIPTKDLPPFFKSWKGMYIFVLGFHTLLILAFYLFTKFFE